MRVLVTGGSGFLGRNLLAVAPAGWDVVALYHRDTTFPDFVADLRNPGIVAVGCDLADAASVAALAAQHGSEWGACVHLAATVDIPWSVREPRADLIANTFPALHLLEQIRVDRMVYFSSGAVYDGLAGEASPDAALSPTLPYAISKLACEHYIQFYQRRRDRIGNCLIVRFFGAYGPYEATHKISTRLVKAFALEKKTHYTIYGDGSNLIDAMHVDDAVRAIRLMVSGDCWNRTVNLAAGNPRRIDGLVEEIASSLGVDGLRLDRQGIANERNEFWGSTREMEACFGFRPEVSLRDGIVRLKEFLEGAAGGTV